MGGINVEELYCQGCGAKIQTDDPKMPGYTPASSLKKETLLCKRCFRLKHYNELQDVEITDNDFLQMVASIRDTKGIVVHLIDIFDVEGSLISSLPRITGDNPILLVANKIDLLPKSTNRRKLTQWLQSKVKAAGIKVEDVALISSKKGDGIQELGSLIDHYRNKQNVYIVGTTNVGKSTFINRLIDQSIGMDDVITTSYFPGTTLGFIEIPLDDHASLIDTPGIVNHEQMAHYVSNQDLKIITPNKEIKPRIFQLNSGQTLFFGGLARLDFVKGERTSFVCYFANGLPIHRTKLENADELYNKHIGEMLSPPDKDTLTMLPLLVRSSFRIKEGRTDIVFPGLGWVSVLDEQKSIDAFAPKGVSISVRKSLL